MTDEELIARLRENQAYEWQDPIWETRLAAADRIEQLVATNEALTAENARLHDHIEGVSKDTHKIMVGYEAKLARAKWLLTDAAVQLEEGKIKTRRNRAGLIWQFLEEIKAT